MGEMNPSPEMVKRCREVLDWHNTGILTGKSLRELAASYGYVADYGTQMKIAEDQTARAAMAFVVSCADRAEPTADVVEAVADSGFTAENITEAEWLWANLPVRGKFHDRPTYERALICHTVARFRARAAITAMPAPQWLDIASAKKNRSTIWAILRDDIYPTLMPGREDLKRWNGLQLPLRHEGVADDGFDIGWMLAAPVGHGGFPDDWIAGWMPMPAAPAKEG